MVYKLSLQTLPEIEETYEIERKTLWRCADRRAILILITEGACRIDIDDNNLTLSKGDYILIPPSKEYIRRPVNDKSCKLLYVHFMLRSTIDSLSNKEAENELKEIINKNASLSVQKRLSLLPTHLYINHHGNTGDGFDELCTLLRQIPQKKISATYVSPLLISLKLVEFLSSVSINVISITASSTVPPDIPPPLRQALSFIQQNYNKKISTEQLCELCHLSPQHMIRLFRKHLGITPIQYITKNKISNAIELLRTSELSIAEIAYSLGYDNPSYFSRMFAKEEGFSPSEIRERIKNYKDDPGALKENN